MTFTFAATGTRAGSKILLALARWLLACVNLPLGFLGARLLRVPNVSAVDNEGRHYDYELITVPRYAPWLSDADFVRVYRGVSANTLVDRYRCFELYQLLHEVAEIDGDIVEVGVWRGGTGALLAATAARLMPNSKVYLCDTFRGVVKVSAMDSAYRGGEHADTSVETVQALLRTLDLSNVELLEGIFPDQTGHLIVSEHIAFCHVDVDVYQSALDVVNWVRRRMPPGGIIVFDDYGFRGCDGVTRLVDELRQSGEWSFFYNLNGHGVLTRRRLAG